MYGKITAEDVKHMCLDRDMFMKDLSKLKPKECINFDEGGDLSNRRVMSKFNYEITQAYQVIRGDNLFTILTLPSIFDLDPYFSKCRVRGLIYVYKRGRFAFWSKKRVRKMLAINQHFYVKNYWIQRPTYSGGYFPKYKGVMEAPYLELKKQKMAATRKKLVEGKGEEESQRDKIIHIMNEKGLTHKEIGENTGLSRSRVSQILSGVVKVNS